jgi:hypothetical protein
MGKEKAGIVSSLVFILLASIFMVIASSFPLERSLGVTGSLYGSAFFPYIILSLLIGFSFIVIVRDLFRLRTARSTISPNSSSDAQSDVKNDQSQKSRILHSTGVWVLCVGFGALWHFSGFLPASILFVGIVGFILGLRSIKGILILASITILLWLIFEHLLNIPLGF